MEKYADDMFKENNYFQWHVWTLTLSTPTAPTLLTMHGMAFCPLKLDSVLH